MLIKKKSKIHGKGVFTTCSIKNRRFFYIIPLDKIYNIPKKHCAYIGRNRWVYDDKVLNYINHSCSPNSRLIIHKTKISLRAKRNIKKGEEITVDYNLTEKGNKKIICNCKSNKCRGYFKIKI